MAAYEVLDFSATEPTPEQLQLAADAWAHDLLVLDNHTVHALACNANNDHAQTRIVEVKGGERGMQQPVGWTRPFDARTQAAFNLSLVEDRNMKRLLDDPEALCQVLGGIAFIRGTADMLAKDKHAIPDSIIPPLTNEEKDNGKTATTVQIYSPEGVTITEKITRLAIDMGVEPIMTSANRSQEPESVTKAAALSFMGATDPAYRPPKLGIFWQDDTTKPHRPRGSYPTVFAGREEFVVARFGCFAVEIIRSLLHGYRVAVPLDLEPPKHPDNVLRMQDLPRDVQRLKGPEFHLGLLAFLGWSR